MEEDGLGNAIKNLIAGIIVFMGMISPLIGYAGWQIGSRNIHAVDAETERRAGGYAMCMYLAERAELDLIEAQAACEELSVAIK